MYKPLIASIACLILTASHSTAWEPLSPAKKKEPLTIGDFIRYQEKNETDKKVASICNDLRSKIKKSLKSISGRNLILDNNILLKANILISAYGQNNCDGERLAKLLKNSKL